MAGQKREHRFLVSVYDTETFFARHYSCERRTAPELELGAVSGDELLRASFAAVLLELRAAYGPGRGFWLFPMTPTHLSAAEVDELWREAVEAVPGARLMRRGDRWIAVDERVLTGAGELAGTSCQAAW